MEDAIEIYRRNFKPSPYLAEPYMIVCLNVIAAESDEEAKREYSTLQQMFLNVVRGDENPLLPPVEHIDWTEEERLAVSSMIRVTFVGGKDSVKDQFIDFQEKYNVDEIMVVSYIFEQEKQIRSYEIFKEIVSAD